MISQEAGGPSFSETDYVCVAADLLGRMTRERQSLELNNRRIALSMAAAGHDLRQRLHMLLGTVELLALTKDDLRSAELSQRAKSLIFRLAGELEQLAVQAERENRPAGPSPQCFGIAEILGRLKCDWEPEAACKLLRFNINQQEYLVESDLRLLTVIMNNVVGNAVKHTMKGGITIDSTIEGRFVVLSVADTGPGISEENLRRSFDFSPRLIKATEGMGLGLSIARRTAEMLGHEFYISAAANGGTCIRLHVPLANRWI